MSRYTAGRKQSSATYHDYTRHSTIAIRMHDAATLRQSLFNVRFKRSAAGAAIFSRPSPAQPVAQAQPTAHIPFSEGSGRIRPPPAWGVYTNPRQIRLGLAPSVCISKSLRGDAALKDLLERGRQLPTAIGRHGQRAHEEGGGSARDASKASSRSGRSASRRTCAVSVHMYPLPMSRAAEMRSASCSLEAIRTA